MTSFILLLSGCAVKRGSGYSDLSITFTYLWLMFLVLAIGAGFYYIFGEDKRRDNAGTAAIICIVLFVAMLITA